MLAGTCHCGAVRIEVPTCPEAATLCNCSLCRRYGATWSYYRVGRARVMGHPEHTDAYISGDKSPRTVRRRRGGCVTHWDLLEPKPDGHMAINVRTFDPEELGDLRIHRLDSAVTWTFLD